MVLSMCALMKWTATQIDVKSAFLQSGIAERDVYVAPPREINPIHFIGFCWLLPTV